MRTILEILIELREALQNELETSISQILTIKNEVAELGAVVNDGEYVDEDRFDRCSQELHKELTKALNRQKLHDAIDDYLGEGPPATPNNVLPFRRPERG
jgi:hypothetical protein